MFITFTTTRTWKWKDTPACSSAEPSDSRRAISSSPCLRSTSADMETTRQNGDICFLSCLLLQPHYLPLSSLYFLSYFSHFRPSLSSFHRSSSTFYSTFSSSFIILISFLFLFPFFSTFSFSYIFSFPFLPVFLPLFPSLPPPSPSSSFTLHLPSLLLLIISLFSFLL